MVECSGHRRVKEVKGLLLLLVFVVAAAAAVVVVVYFLQIMIEFALKMTRKFTLQTRFVLVSNRAWT